MSYEAKGLFKKRKIKTSIYFPHLLYIKEIFYRSRIVNYCHYPHLTYYGLSLPKYIILIKFIIHFSFKSQRFQEIPKNIPPLTCYL